MVRKVIVEIDQTNKIPLEKFSKLVKVLSKSYEHKIEFAREDLVGVSEIVENLSHHTEEIKVEEDCAVLSMDRAVVEENLDEYILDRLKKYNYKKYPKNYDELVEKYLKEKLENRKAEERKIAALRDEINKSQNEKKNQKIESIIRIYQERIRNQNRENMLFSKWRESLSVMTPDVITTDRKFDRRSVRPAGYHVISRLHQGTPRQCHRCGSNISQSVP